MKRSKAFGTGLLCLLPLCAWMVVGDAATAERRPKSVRIVYLVSADRTVREDFRNGIETAAKDLQRWYAKQLGGPTFQLNSPVVEVVRSDKDARWFYGHPNGNDEDDWGFNNGLAEARRLVGARHGDPEYVWVIYSDGPGNKGRGGGGVTVLPEDDLLGLVGQHPQQKDVYKGGSFTKYVRDGESEWVESKTDGTAEFRFVETTRDKDWIRLVDSSRGMALRLPVVVGWCSWSTDDGRKWNVLYQVEKAK